jgi:hypothetical protein
MFLGFVVRVLRLMYVSSLIIFLVFILLVAVSISLYYLVHFFDNGIYCN